MASAAAGAGAGAGTDTVRASIVVQRSFEYNKVLVGQFDEEPVPGTKGKEKVLLPRFSEFVKPVQSYKLVQPPIKRRSHTPEDKKRLEEEARVHPAKMVLHDKGKNVSFTGEKQSKTVTHLALVKQAGRNSEGKEVYSAVLIHDWYTFKRDVAIQDVPADDVNKVMERHIKYQKRREAARYIPTGKRQAPSGEEDDVNETRDRYDPVSDSYRSSLAEEERVAVGRNAKGKKGFAKKIGGQAKAGDINELLSEERARLPGEVDGESVGMDYNIQEEFDDDDGDLPSDDPYKSDPDADEEEPSDDEEEEEGSGNASDASGEDDHDDRPKIDDAAESDDDALKPMKPLERPRKRRRGQDVPPSAGIPPKSVDGVISASAAGKASTSVGAGDRPSSTPGAAAGNSAGGPASAPTPAAGAGAVPSAVGTGLTPSKPVAPVPSATASAAGTAYGANIARTIRKEMLDFVIGEGGTVSFKAVTKRLKKMLKKHGDVHRPLMLEALGQITIKKTVSKRGGDEVVVYQIKRAFIPK